MKFENTKVYGFENAIIGLRLPMCKDFEEAKNKSDSMKIDWSEDFCVNSKDLDLMQHLIKADEKASGQPNSKFLRMIHVQVAITAPLYWWKEADTYKIATVTNSTSTMHKLASTPITLDCFEMGDFEDISLSVNDEVFGSIGSYWQEFANFLDNLRQQYNKTKDKKYWKELIRLLPESYLQTRMFDCNYSTLRNIYKQRCEKPHKLTEWSIDFCNWIKTLPYAKELLTDGE